VAAGLAQRLAAEGDPRSGQQAFTLRPRKPEVRARGIPDCGEASMQHVAQDGCGMRRDVADRPRADGWEVGGGRGDVHVGVDQARHHDQRGCVDHVGAAGSADVGADLHDPPVHGEDVVLVQFPGGDVQHPAAAHEHAAHPNIIPDAPSFRAASRHVGRRGRGDVQPPSLAQVLQGLTGRREAEEEHDRDPREEDGGGHREHTGEAERGREESDDRFSLHHAAEKYPGTCAT